MDITQLGISIATDQIRAGLRELDKIEKAANATADAADRVGRESEQAFKKTTRGASEAARAYQGVDAAAKSAFTSMQTGASGAGQALDRLQRILIGGFAGGIVAGNIIGAADAYTKLTAQLRIATSGAEQFNQAYSQVVGITRESQGNLEAVSALYTRIANSTKEAGVSLAQVGDITKTVSLGLKLSGASAAESSSAMLQLSQAFASGVLRGEEFNAVSEAAFPLMNALAKSMGVPIERLREMASQGLITRDVMVKAFTDPELIKTFEAQAREVQNVSSAFQLLKTDLTLFIGEADQATGASSALAGMIKGLADFINQNGDGITSFFTGIAAAGVAAGVLALAANIGVLTGALRSFLLVSAIAAANPVVLALLAVGAVAGTAMYFKQQADDMDKLVGSSVELVKIQKEIDDLQSKQSSRNGRLSQEELARSQRLNELRKQQSVLLDEARNKQRGATESAVTGADREYQAMMSVFDTQFNMNKAVEEYEKKLSKAGSTGGDAYKSILAEATRYLESIQSVIDKEAMRGEALKQQLILGRELTDSEKQHIENVQKFGAAVANGLKAQSEANDLLEKKVEALKDLEKANKKALEDARKENDSITEGNKKLEEEIEKIGLKSSALAELEAQYAATAAQAARMGAEEAFQRGDDALGQTFLKRAEELEKRVLLLRKKGAKEAAKAIEDENEKASEEFKKQNAKAIEDFEEGFLKAFGELKSGGKGFAESLKRSLESELNKMVIRPLLQAGSSALFGSKDGASQGILGNTLGSLGGSVLKNGIFSTATIGTAISQAGATFGSSALASFGQGIAASGTAGAGATGLFGAGQAIGAAAPWAIAAIAAYNLLKKDKISAVDLAEKQTKPIQEAIYAGFGATLSAFGGTGSILSNVTGNTGRQGQNPNFSVRGTGYSSNDFFGGDDLFAAGEIAMNEENIAEQISRAIFAGLREADFKDNLDALFDSIDPVTASLEQLNLAMQGAQVLDAINDNFAQLEGNLQGLAGASLETIQGFINATGGFENFNSLLAGFIDTFYTDAEKFDRSVSQATQAIEALNLVVPQTREAFRALVEAQDLTTEAGQRAYASLLAMSGSVDSIFDTLDARAKESADNSRATDQVASQRLGLETQILQLMGNTAELRRRELEALDPANRAYQEHIYLLEDARDAQDKRNEALQNEKDALQRLVDAGRSIKEVINQITLSLTNNPASRTLGAGALFQQQLGLARGNDTNALGSIGGAATAAIDAARSSSRSFVEFQRQALRIRADLQSLPAVKSFEEQLLIAIQELKIDLTKFLGSSGVLANSISDGFSKIDVNLDGKLTFDELKAALGDKATDEELRRIFRELDTNGDGVIDQLEALNGKTQSLAGAIKDGLSPLFSKIDTSLNGLIDPTEFSAAFASFGLGDKIDLLRQAFDFNNDNQISAIEALGAKVVQGSTLAKNAIDFGFVSLDTSVDGLLSFDELKAGLGAFIKDDAIIGLLREIDTDGNGQISAIEAQTARIGALAVEIRNNLAPLFDSVDLDVSGGITKDEFSQVFGGLGLGQKLDSIFSELDVNGDGTISRLEAGNRTSDQILGQLASDSILKYSAAEVRSAYVSGGRTLAQWLELIAGQGGSSTAGASGSTQSTPSNIDSSALNQAIVINDGASDLQKGAFYKYALSRGLDNAGINAAIAQALGPSKQLGASDFDYLNRIGDINNYTGPRFARGGDYMGGMALVGEEGPELINFNRGGRVYNARDSAKMMDFSGMLAELRALRSEVSNLRAENSRENYAIAKNTMNVANRLERFDDGDRLRVTIEQDTGETVNVTVVP